MIGAGCGPSLRGRPLRAFSRPALTPASGAFHGLILAAMGAGFPQGAGRRRRFANALRRHVLRWQGGSVIRSFCSGIRLEALRGAPHDPPSHDLKMVRRGLGEDLTAIQPMGVTYQQRG